MTSHQDDLANDDVLTDIDDIASLSSCEDEGEGDAAGVDAKVNSNVDAKHVGSADIINAESLV